MVKEAMKGVDFYISGVVNTPNSAYAVFINGDCSSYFPVECGKSHSILVESVLSETADFNIENFGLYFSFLSMLKAHDIFPTNFSFIVGKKSGLSCSLDVVEDNELGTKVSRIPMLIADAVVVSVLGRIPVVIYGVAGKDFAFKIDKGIPRNNVLAFACEEIARAEKMAALGLEESQEG